MSTITQTLISDVTSIGNTFTGYGGDGNKSNVSFSLLISKLNELDKEFSDIIHKMELGLIDILIAIPGTLFGVIGCPILAIWYYHKYNSWLYPFNCFIVTAINHTTKYIIMRQRPLQCNIGKKLIPLKKMHHDPAMPSGDTAQASVAVATLIFHGYSGLWSILIPCSAFARVYFGSHFIGDTVVGGMFAFILTMGLNYYLFQYFES